VAAQVVDESHGAVRVFSRRNCPEDAVLTMDVHPLKLNLGAVGGHLEVDRQLPDGILPPRRASIEETHDCSLQKVLGIVDIAEDVLRGMVAKSSVRDGVDDRAHLVPQVFLCRHRSQNNDDE